MLKSNLLVLITIFSTASLFSQIDTDKRYDAIYSGTPWFDEQGQVINAHGACIIKEKGTYYLFGEAHTDTSNAFVSFNCYSSTDLYNWKFENQVLKVQKSGLLGPNRIGERVKVMKCPKTGEFVMYMHTDDIKYSDPNVGYATSSSINGDYKFQGALLFNGNPIKMWDMGTFQDTDNTGYLLIHEGNIYKLSDDYKTVEKHIVKNVIPGGESPTMLKKDGIYYWIVSNKTSWERNDNYYQTATSIAGPWKKQGIFTPKDKLTWNSQSTFVLPIVGSKQTTYMYMGDRWSYPRQETAATYVWQPLVIENGTLSIPTFNDAWTINSITGEWSSKEITGKTVKNKNCFLGKKHLVYDGSWTHTKNTDTSLSESITNIEGASLEIPFKGTRISILGISKNIGGYAKIEITDTNGTVIISSIIDFYSKYTDESAKFVSPLLKKGAYTFKISALGEHGNWYNKAGTEYGSSDHFISIHKAIIEN